MAKRTGNSPNASAKDAGRTPAWRAGMDFILMLAGAVLIALLIKAYVVDVYLIPSGSMETTLHGRPDGGDRILCSKLNYRFRNPARWEVAVFEFPYETARRSDPRISETYRGQNFVKRVVGLPGESLAIGRGDIWVRREGDSEYQRLAKPDSVQRGMWQKVYFEDFSDLHTDELSTFWRVLGHESIQMDPGALRLSPGSEGIRLDYRPLNPSGPDRKFMVELPGIPDRYVLRQPVQFRCQTPTRDGGKCGQVFVKTVETHNIQARCPTCHTLLDETAAIFYHRRSGLPGVGRYAVDPRFAKQSEETIPRQADYHFVPDLRSRVQVALIDAKATLVITHREENRFVNAVIHGDGRFELQINGEQSRPEHRAVIPVRTGVSHNLEFYVVDGVARFFFDGNDAPALDVPVWEDARPMPRNTVRSSGVSLSAFNGDMVIANIAIDRDIYYYSGWENEIGEQFNAMNSQGEVYINSSSFFPMGDHCTSSYDARSWGPVPLRLVRGPALLVWWPPERIGWISSP